MARRKGLRRWLRAQQRERAERAEAAAPPRDVPMFTVDGVGVFARIAEYVAALVSPRSGVALIEMHVRDPAPLTGAPPAPRQREPEPEQRTPRPTVITPVEPPADPFGFAAMSIDQLRAAGLCAMPGVQRLALEAALNRKLRELRNPPARDLTPEEHEAAWRGFGAWH